MVGGLIMCHGDDRGLVVPPRLASIQVVVVLVKDGPEVRAAAGDLMTGLQAGGVRAELDDAVETSFGRRVVDWELKGVPVRLEIGPRDVEAGTVSLVRRDTGSRQPVPLASAVVSAADMLDTIQVDMLTAATARRDENLHDVDTIEDAVGAAAEGFGRMSWSALRADDGETRLRTQGITVRCLQRPDGSLPFDEDEPDLVAIVSRAY
jgi:prolyl-tRNA synthetase